MRRESIPIRARMLRILCLAFFAVLLLPCVPSDISMSAQSLSSTPSIPGSAAPVLKPSLAWSTGATMYRDLFTPATSVAPQLFSAQPAKETRFVDRLLRFEIITLGAFPIMLFYTDVGFSLGTYIASGFDLASAPWPFGSSSTTMDTQERLLHIAVGVALSCTVAIFDLIKNLNEEAKARNRSNLDRVSGSY